MAYILIVILFLLFIFSAYYLSGRSRYNLPPGPRGLPIFGNAIDLYGRDLRDVFIEYRQKYGDIFSFRIFRRIFIVCNGYEMLKEMFVKHGDVFSQRPAFDLILETKAGSGFLAPKSQQWVESRRYFIRALRDSGMGKNIMQTRIKNEVELLVDKIEAFDGKPFKINPLLYSCVGNIIFTVMFGERYEYEDPLFQEITQTIHEQAVSPATFVPSFFKYIPGDPFHIRKFIRNAKRIKQFYSEVVDQHLDSYQDGSPTNFIDVCIKEIRDSVSEGRDTPMNKNELLFMLELLGLASTDTTATVLLWGLMFILHDPSVQDRLAQEIDDVTSQDRKPDVSDKMKLPYLEATTNEILRRASIAPFADPHAASRDTTFRGYDIPDDAFILPSLDSVLFDEDIWRDPKSFRPTRFLNGDGSVKRMDELIPFSLGKRMCPGESLARMEIFLIFTALVRTFEFKTPEGKDAPPIESKLGMTVAPNDFFIRAIPRKAVK